MAKTLLAYDIDIAALSETRLSGEGSLTEIGQGYTFFWRGVPEGQPRIHGVGLAVRSSLLKSIQELPVGHSERLMTVRIPLERSNHMTIISAYAPTLAATEETKDEFYASLAAVLQTVERGDRLVLMGDFNARVGSDYMIWEGVLGRHGTGKMNSNGLRFLSLCSEFGLVITNTMYQLKNKHKNTWKHPRSGHWHMIDHVAIRRRDAKECRLTRVMRGADCSTDHRMQRTLLTVKIRPPVRRRGVTARKLDTNKLKSPEITHNFEERISAALEGVLPSNMSLSVAWATAAERLSRVAVDVLGYRKKKHRDWFDENDEELNLLVAAKNSAHNSYLSNPSRHNHTNWKQLQSQLQRETRRLKNDWWIMQAQEIQRYADEGQAQSFYDAIKRVNGPPTSCVNPLKSSDGAQLLKSKEDILKRWAEYFGALLNSANPTDMSAIEELPQYPIATEMDEPITETEVAKAIKSMKSGKAAGPDGLPPDLFRHGGAALLQFLTEFSQRCWQEKTVPTQWLRANIVTIYKRKGEKSECGNYRGLSLLDVAGKIFTKVLNSRFNKYLAEKILPETQSGFRAGRGTTDMIFVCRQMLEKGREQQAPISMGFVDLKKAFDTVNREMLFAVLERFGCPPTFLALIKALHTGNTATVRVGGELSDDFGVSMGVKQGCVLAPLLFNVFLLAVTLLATNEPDEAQQEIGGVRLRYRFDGGAFNLQRLRARGLVDYVSVRDLQYADDAAVLAGGPEELQAEMTQTNRQYSRLGLLMNKTKTEIMHRPTSTHSEPLAITIDGTQLPEATDFTYLGSIISNNCSLDREINNRISRASAAFGQLKDRVYLNSNLRLNTKMKVYEAIVLSILLYSSETWTPYSSQVKVLNKFHLQCLRKMLRITWRDKITNNEVLSRCGSAHIQSILAKRTLRWVGHVERMEANRLPKQVFYSELAVGQRPIGRPKKRYKDHVKDTLKRCNIPPSGFERTATDRDEWRRAIMTGADHYELTLRERNEASRRARHQQNPVNPANRGLVVCRECGRAFRSGAGLASHERAHLRRQRESGRHRIDGLP